MDVPTLPDISRILSMSAITLPAPGSPRLPQLSPRLERELVALGRRRLAAEDMPWTWRERSLARRSRRSTEASEGRALSSASTEAASMPDSLLHSDYSDWKPRRRAAAAGSLWSLSLNPLSRVRLCRLSGGTFSGRLAASVGTMRRARLWRRPRKQHRPHQGGTEA